MGPGSIYPCDYPISLSRMSSGCVRISVIFNAPYFPYLFIYSSVSRLLACLHLLVFMNRETVNKTMQVFFFVTLLSTLLEGCGLDGICPLKAHFLEVLPPMKCFAKWLHHEGSDLINALAIDRLMI